MLAQESQTALQAKFPVWRTVGKAYALVFGNLGTFFPLAVIPIAVSFLPLVAEIAGLVTRPPVPFVPPIPDPTGPPVQFSVRMDTDSWILVVYLIVAISWVVFLVSWHRFVLLGHRDTRSPVQFRLGRREVRFILYGLLFVITGMILWLIFGMVLFFTLGPTGFPPSFFEMFINLILLFLLNFALVFLVLAPFLLLFPAVAVDSDTGLRTAWKQGRGLRWRLFWVVSVASIPFFILMQFMWFMWSLGGLPVEFLEAASVLTRVAQNFVYFLASAVGATILSMAFGWQTQWSPTSPEADR